MTVRRFEPRRTSVTTPSSASSASQRSATRHGAGFMRLQSSHGNRAVQTLIRDTAARAEDHPGTEDRLGGHRVPPGVDAVLRRRRGTGAPLPGRVARDLGARFGVGLGAVRVHADAEASELARAFEAEAFAHGRDVYFGAGAYRPHSSGGRRLIAHEVAHTLQHRTSVGGAAVIGRVDDPAERRADVLADAALRRTGTVAPARTSDGQPAGPSAGGAVAPRPTPGTNIHRQVRKIKVALPGKAKKKKYVTKWYSSEDDAKTTFDTHSEAEAHENLVIASRPVRVPPSRGAKADVDYAAQQKAPGYRLKRNPDWDYPDKALADASDDVSEEYAKRRKRAPMTDVLTEEMIAFSAARPKKYLTKQDKAMIKSPHQSLAAAKISRNHKIADSSVTTICLQLVENLGALMKVSKKQDKAVRDFIAAFSSKSAVQKFAYKALMDAASEIRNNNKTLAQVSTNVHTASGALSMSPQNLRFGDATLNEQISYAADYNRKKDGSITPLSEALQQAVLDLAEEDLIPQEMADSATTPAYDTIVKALMSSGVAMG